MKAIWIPAAPILSHVIEPIQGLSIPTRAELSAGRDLTASERRLQLPNFVEMFHWEAANRQHIADIKKLRSTAR